MILTSYTYRIGIGRQIHKRTCLGEVSRTYEIENLYLLNVVDNLDIKSVINFVLCSDSMYLMIVHIIMLKKINYQTADIKTKAQTSIIKDDRECAFMH